MAASEAGFEEFFETQHERLFHALFLLTGDRAEADDLTQEALLRVYERWDRVRSMDTPDGYLFRTALNLNRSRVRKLLVRRRTVFAAVPEEDPSGSVTVALEIRRALAAIPQAQREALILTGWLGLDSEEAGRILGIDASSVRGRAHRGRDSLHKMLGDADG